MLGYGFLSEKHRTSVADKIHQQMDELGDRQRDELERLRAENAEMKAILRAIQRRARRNLRRRQQRAERRKG